MNAQTLLAAFDFSNTKGLVQLLVSILVLALIFWLVYTILEWMKVPPPVNMVARVLLGIVAILVLLRLVGII